MTNDEYENYLDERKALLTAELEQAKLFDKYILTLASGSFGLSLLFIRQITPQPEAGTIWLLSFAWIAFGLSILSTLASLLLSQQGFSRQREILDEKYKTNAKDDVNNAFVPWIKRLNLSSMGFFMAGVCLLAIFSIVNL